jgi:hypothetical protein
MLWTKTYIRLVLQLTKIEKARLNPELVEFKRAFYLC